jgi:hypothetical protein
VVNVVGNRFQPLHFTSPNQELNGEYVRKAILFDAAANYKAIT